MQSLADVHGIDVVRSLWESAVDYDGFEALERALAGETITHLIVTHTHGDHSPAAAPLQVACGAPTLAPNASR